MKELTMASPPYRVGLIVDRNFGDRISDLARAFHVWVIASPRNSPVIRAFWNGQSRGHDEDLLASGITSFDATDQESPEDSCVRMASELDEHHGEFSHDPPWSEIAVFGAKLSASVKNAFAEIGATSFESTSDGFVCRREIRTRSEPAQPS